MSTSEKIDLYKLHKEEYAAPRQPVLITIPKACYLGIQGRGAPGSKEFETGIGALYAMAFTIKMTRKFAGKGDYVICKLEGQWWGDAEGRPLMEIPKKDWSWRLMIRTPDFIRKSDLREAAAKLQENGKGARVSEVELTRLTEGRSVQMLHLGPYEEERKTIAQMEEFAASQGFSARGPHHEIYLSDPRRVPPERLRTLLRLPVRRGSAAR